MKRYTSSKTGNKNIHVDYQAPAFLVFSAFVCIALAFTVGTWFQTQNTASQLDNAIENITTFESQIIAEIEQKLNTINNVPPGPEGSKKKMPQAGNIDLIAGTGFVISPDAPNSEIDIATDESSVQRRVSDYCSNGEFAVAMLKNGSLVCEPISNDIARLDMNGMLFEENVPLQTLKYLCTWDALNNVPELNDANCTTERIGTFFSVSVAGTTTLGGSSDWQVADFVFCTESGFIRNAHVPKVFSVNGKTSNVMLSHFDLNDIDPNEHIDHSTLSLQGGTFINGGGPLTTSQSFNINPMLIQRRISPDCGAGNAINSVAEDGTPTCISPSFDLTYNLFRPTGFVASSRCDDVDVYFGTPQIWHDVPGMSTGPLSPGKYLIAYGVCMLCTNVPIKVQLIDNGDVVVPNSVAMDVQDAANSFDRLVYVEPTVTTTYRFQFQYSTSSGTCFFCDGRYTSTFDGDPDNHCMTQMWYLKLT